MQSSHFLVVILYSFPAGQSRQYEEPRFDEPEVQDLHAVWPPLSAKYPMLHSTQEPEVFAPTALLCFPGGQSLHLATAFSPGVLEKVPPGHGRHKASFAAPTASLQVPMVHGSQSAFSCSNVPAGQDKHCPPAREVCPLGHGSHNLVFGLNSLPAKQSLQYEDPRIDEPAVHASHTV